MMAAEAARAAEYRHAAGHPPLSPPRLGPGVLWGAALGTPLGPGMPLVCCSCDLGGFQAPGPPVTQGSPPPVKGGAGRGTQTLPCSDGRTPRPTSTGCSSAGQRGLLAQGFHGGSRRRSEHPGADGAPLCSKSLGGGGAGVARPPGRLRDPRPCPPRPEGTAAEGDAGFALDDQSWLPQSPHDPRDSAPAMRGTPGCRDEYRRHVPRVRASGRSGAGGLRVGVRVGRAPGPPAGPAWLPAAVLGQLLTAACPLLAQVSQPGTLVTRGHRACGEQARWDGPRA